MAFRINNFRMEENINTAVIWSCEGNQQGALGLLCQNPLNEVQKSKIQSILEEISQKNPLDFHPYKIRLYEILFQANGCKTSEFYAVVSNQVAGFQIKSAAINYIHEDFVDSSPIPLKNSNKKNVNIFCVQNYKELMFRFNFHNNGFQYCEFKGNLLDSVCKLSVAPFNEDCRSDLHDCTIPFLNEWGKANHIDFDDVALLGFYFRDTEKGSKGGTPVFFAHTDFQQSNIKDIALSLEAEWKPNLECIFGPLSKGQYHNLNMVQIVNLWMPLNRNPTSNTLAVMDTLSRDESTPLRPFSNPGRNNDLQDGAFNSMTLCASTDHRWVAHESMVLGQAIIFNSYVTPHTAVDIPLNDGFGPNHYRKSIEGRYAFIKF